MGCPCCRKTFCECKFSTVGKPLDETHGASDAEPFDVCVIHVRQLPWLSEEFMEEFLT